MKMDDGVGFNCLTQGHHEKGMLSVSGFDFHKLVTSEVQTELYTNGPGCCEEVNYNAGEEHKGFNSNYFSREELIK